MAIATDFLPIIRKLMPSLCTIQSKTDTRDSAGQPIPTWANLTGHVNIPCAVGPGVQSRGGTNEVRLVDETLTIIPRQVLLQGYYPSITSLMQAVIGGVTYRVLGVEADSSHQITRLNVEEVS